MTMPQLVGYAIHNFGAGYDALIVRIPRAVITSY